MNGKIFVRKYSNSKLLDKKCCMPDNEKREKLGGMIPMKRKIVSAALACALAASLSVPALAADLTFSDVPSNHWAAQPIMEMTEQGLFSGTTAPVNGVGTFAPDATMTRGAFLTVLTRWLFGDELDAMSVVPGAPWWKSNYTLALQNGLLKDKELGDDLDKAMNRQEMAVVLARAAQGLGLAPDTLVSESAIPDWYSIGEGYREGVRFSYSMGFIGGVDSKGTFNPNGTLTRAQAATVVYRLLEKIEGGEPNWNSGRIDITCDMDSMVVVPGNNGISTIVDARTWSPSNMTKTIAYMESVTPLYVDGAGYPGVMTVDEENKKLWLNLCQDGSGQVNITATVDTVGTEGQFNDVLISGLDKNGTFKDVSRTFLDTFLSETVSTEARQKIMAAYDIYLDNYKQYADNEWYNDENKTAVIDAWENTVMSTNYKVNDDVVLSLSFSGWHVSDIGYYEENGWALTDISELKSIW